MQGGAGDQRVGQRLVQFLQPFFAPEGVARLQKTGQAQAQHQRAENEDHQGTDRIVPGLERMLSFQQIEHMPLEASWRREEIVETCVPAADESPYDARQNECAGRVPQPAMQRFAVVEQESVDQYAADQRPMKKADKTVPDRNTDDF